MRSWGGRVAVVILIGLGGLLLWWHFVWQSPERVFEDMLANNLSTPSVTENLSVDVNGQSLQQTARLSMGSLNAADWVVVAKQNGSTVATENIGTATTGYIRYTKIVAGPGAKQFKNTASVLNVWGKYDGKTDTSLAGIYSQTLFDITNAPVPPISNLPSDQRENLLAYNRDEKVFTPDYTKVKHEVIAGHEVDTFTVAVQLGAYIRLMQGFAHDLGMTNLDQLDPSQYSTVAPVEMTMSVDVSSHQLVRVAYASSGFSQTYSDWGVLSPVSLPAKTITTTELQDRLQTLTD